MTKSMDGPDRVKWIQDMNLGTKSTDFFSFATMMDLSEYISNLAEKKDLCNGERMIFTGWGFEFN